MTGRWIAVLNLSLVSAFVFLGGSIVSPILPQYAMTFNIPVALTGWAISSYALARVVTDLPAGMLSDKYGRKNVMLVGLVIIVFSSLAAGLAPTYFLLIISRVLGGLGAALYITSSTSCLADISQGRDRGKIMSVYSGLVFMGLSAGPALGGFVAAFYGIQAPFYVYALLSTIGLMTITLFREPMSENNPEKHVHWWSNIKSLASNRSFILVNISVFAIFFLRSGSRNTLLPLYASINLGLGLDQIGLIIAVAMLATGLTVFPSGWLSDKVGRKIPLMASIFSSALLTSLIPFLGNLNSLLMLMIVYGFAAGLQGSISAWPADVAPSDKMGIAMSMFRFIADLAIFLGPITVTYANDYFNPNLINFQAFFIPSIIAIVAGVVLVKADDPTRKR